MKEILEKIFEIAIDINNLIELWTWEKLNNSINSSGENQIWLDILSDEIVRKKLLDISNINSIISEEKNEILEINKSWKYKIAYDPLDGSSLIDVNLSIWSIFWIYENDFTWKNLVSAIYIVYWPRLEVVFADINLVQFFRKIWTKFIELPINHLKEKWYILSPWALQVDWLNYHKNLINSFWNNWYKLRYSGSMVPDLHQIILKWWGLFCYPEIKNKPNWKLRKLFEVFPFAFIIEKLWWWAIDNNWKRILDNSYKNIHDSIACYIWSSWEIEKVKKILNP